ncbi:MAG: hypothetical protein ACP5MV_00535 [Candidatus Parvarchaeum sp.]
METKYKDKTLEKLLSADKWRSKGYFTSEEVSKTIQDFYNELGESRALKFSRYLNNYINDINELDKVQKILQDYGLVIYSSGIVGRRLKEIGPGLVMKTTVGFILRDLEKKVSEKEYKISIYEAENELVNDYFANF